MLKIEDLSVNVENISILKNINLNFEKGKINVLMGQNGSGKSTLANAILGNPKYKVTSGKLIYNNEDITNLKTNERAKKGIFMSFQSPEEIHGLSFFSFLRTALNSKLKKENSVSVFDFHASLREKMSLLNLKSDFLKRDLNEGFSGGEKKLSEILQMLILNPDFIILDEPDSGLDIDHLKNISSAINSFMNKDKCFLIITHYNRILQYLSPDKIIIMKDGKIALEGDGSLANKLEEKGYSFLEDDKSPQVVGTINP